MSTVTVNGFRRQVGSRSAISGFTLVEVLLVAALIVTVGAIAIPVYRQALEQARIVKAIADITTISLQISAFRAANNAYPASLDELGTVHRTDPWSRPYQYLLIFGAKKPPQGVRKDKGLKPLNSDYDLYSVGKDGESKEQLNDKKSLDDIVRAIDGAFIGLGRDF